MAGESDNSRNRGFSAGLKKALVAICVWAGMGVGQSSIAEGQSWAAATDKISEEILYHQQEKARLGPSPGAEDKARLEARGMNLAIGAAEDSALYVSRPLTLDEIAGLARDGIRVHPEGWVPSVPDQHPFGFYQATVDYASLDCNANATADE